MGAVKNHFWDEINERAETEFSARDEETMKFEHKKMLENEREENE